MKREKAKTKYSRTQKRSCPFSLVHNIMHSGEARQVLHYNLVAAKQQTGDKKYRKSKYSMDEYERQSLAVNTTTTTAALAYSTNDKFYDEEVEPYRKQGTILFGCLCDTRRASILISIFLIFGVGLFNVVILIGERFLETAASHDFDDDILETSLLKLTRMQIICMATGIVASVFSLIGAVTFNAWFVGVNVVWLGLNLVVLIAAEIGIVSKIKTSFAGTEQVELPFGAVVLQCMATSLVMYPLLLFIREVRLGIMSEETYLREEYSFCCMN